jgi:hypothetical protein
LTRTEHSGGNLILWWARFALTAGGRAGAGWLINADLLP